MRELRFRMEQFQYQQVSLELRAIFLREGRVIIAEVMVIAPRRDETAGRLMPYAVQEDSGFSGETGCGHVVVVR